MAELKTKKTDASVAEFLAGVSHEKRRQDCERVIELMREITGEEPAMWGPSIIGFGQYTYRYDSGHTGECALTGVSPRKQALSIYLSCEGKKREQLLAKLGKHKMGAGCLYINKLEDVDLPTLKKLIKASVDQAKKRHVG